MINLIKLVKRIQKLITKKENPLLRPLMDQEADFDLSDKEDFYHAKALGELASLCPEMAKIAVKVS